MREKIENKLWVIELYTAQAFFGKSGSQLKCGREFAGFGEADAFVVHVFGNRQATQFLQATAFFKRSSATSITLRPTVPELRNKAISSALLKAAGPYLSIFSRGKSRSGLSFNRGHDVSLGMFIRYSGLVLGFFDLGFGLDHGLCDLRVVGF